MESNNKQNKARLSEYSLEDIDKCLDFIRDRTPVSDTEGGIMMPSQKQQLEEHEEELERINERINEQQQQQDALKQSVESNSQRIASISDVNGLTPMTEEELMLILQ